MKSIRAALTLVTTAGILAMLGFWAYSRTQLVTASYAFVRGTAVEVGSPFNGRIAAISVRPGQHVQAGEVLVQLDDTRERMEHERALAAWECAKARVEVERQSLTAQRVKAVATRGAVDANLRVRQAEARAAEVQVSLASRQADRAAQLTQLGSASQSDADTALANRQGADENMQRASERIALAHAERQQADVELSTIGVRRAQLALLEAEAEAALAAVRAAESALHQMQVRAPRAGVVQRTLIGPGSAVRVGASLLEIWFDDAVWVEAWVDEISYADLHLGAPAQASLIGGDGAKLRGRVERLGVVTDAELKAASFSIPLAKLLAKSRWVRVTIALDRANPRLMPGLSLDVVMPRSDPASEQLFVDRLR